MTWTPLLQPVCGRCGRRREGIRHVCRSNSNRRATVTLKFSFGKCSKCRKDVTNPLTHNCAPKSDFKRRRARHEKQARTARKKDRHDYQSCSDKDCQRSLCVAFRTGYQAGEADGFDRGWTAGFPAGQAACPLPHG